MWLRTGFFRDGSGRQEILVKSFGVAGQKLVDARMVGGFQDETGVMISCNPVDDFRIVIGGRVRLLLPSQRDNRARIVATRFGQWVRLLPCSDLEARPVAPKIDSGGGVDHVGDVGSSDACGDFEEIELSVGVCFQKFGVGDAAKKAEVLKNATVKFEEQFCFCRIARKSPRRENTALV